MTEKTSEQIAKEKLEEFEAKERSFKTRFVAPWLNAGRFIIKLFTSNENVL